MIHVCALNNQFYKPLEHYSNVLACLVTSNKHTCTHIHTHVHTVKCTCTHTYTPKHTYIHIQALTNFIPTSIISSFTPIYSMWWLYIVLWFIPDLLHKVPFQYHKLVLALSLSLPLLLLLLSLILYSSLFPSLSLSFPFSLPSTKLKASIHSCVYSHLIKALLLFFCTCVLVQCMVLIVSLGSSSMVMHAHLLQTPSSQLLYNTATIMDCSHHNYPLSTSPTIHNTMDNNYYCAVIVHCMYCTYIL